MNDRDLPEHLRRWRRWKGWTQREVAKRMGLKCPSTVGGWEIGRSPTWANLCRVAEIYGFGSVSAFLAMQAPEREGK